jgi:hypothetical protein
MDFREEVNDHITRTLSEGVLPDSDTIVEMEVPNQKPGPQHSGDEGGPKSAPSKVFPWMMTDKPPKFRSHPNTIPPAKFRDQNRQIPPARFGSAASDMKEEAVAAVMADLDSLQTDAE